MRGVEARERARALFSTSHEVGTDRSAEDDGNFMGRHMVSVVCQQRNPEGFAFFAIVGLRFALRGAYRLKKGQYARSYYTTSVREY